MKVLIVTGASGGHIFPAASFTEALKNKHGRIEILLVLPRKSIQNCNLPKDCSIRYLSILPIKLGLNLRVVAAIFGFIKGVFESLFLLVEFRPDYAVGFGSINSVPLLFFAWIFRIRTLIHEQNVVPGRANRFLAKFMDKVAISFAETRNYLRIDPKKIVLTGNPVRNDLVRIDKPQALFFFGFSKEKFTVLVMGGSKGAHKINTAFLHAASIMEHNYDLQVIHISGQDDYDFLKGRYKDLNTEVRLFIFLKEMQYAYSSVDLVISRAGATTIAELMTYRLPAIIIPYPFASLHQLCNAKTLEKLGSAIIINDYDLDAHLLKKTLEELMSNPDKLEIMRSRYNNIPVNNANELLENALLSLN
jgi:UDP-N-acetylglucosamine--N-acetylmuramyl-(pentapeptide) pyrophosphoryl-undecaprenol N-acetylglucosamine transferase